jgi:hypothetical protein
MSCQHVCVFNCSVPFLIHVISSLLCNCGHRQQTGLKTCYCYKVLEKDSSVVHSKFMHEKYVESSDEAPLVVATPNYVSSFNMDL